MSGVDLRGAIVNTWPALFPPHIKIIVTKCGLFYFLNGTVEIIWCGPTNYPIGMIMSLNPLQIACAPRYPINGPRCSVPVF